MLLQVPVPQPANAAVQSVNDDDDVDGGTLQVHHLLPLSALFPLADPNPDSDWNLNRISVCFWE